MLTQILVPVDPPFAPGATAPRIAAGTTQAVAGLPAGSPSSWSAWEDLHGRTGQRDPILSAAFLIPWLESFVPARLEPTLLADGVAALAMAQPERHGGLPVRTWRLCVNDHSQRAPLLYAEGREREAAQALLAFARQHQSRFDAFRLRGLPVDGSLADAVIEAARAAGMAVDLDSRRSQFMLDLSAFASANAYFASRGSTTEHTLRKQGRRLARLGNLSVHLAAGEALPAAFADFMAVEERSWKSVRGEILAADAGVERFYDHLVRSFDEGGGACIWTLRLDERAIASAITLRRGRRCLGLKLVFDEEFAAFSPGRQLLRPMIERQFQDGCDTFDFFSGMEAWRHWSNTTRTFQDVTLWSATLRGRALVMARRGLHAVKAATGRSGGKGPVRRGGSAAADG